MGVKRHNAVRFSVVQLLSLSFHNPQPVLMESSSSTPRPAVSATTGRQEGQAVDETLAHIDELLKILNGAASFLPGAGAVVPALQSIVGQIRVSKKCQFVCLCSLTPP